MEIDIAIQKHRNGAIRKEIRQKSQVPVVVEKKPAETQLKESGTKFYVENGRKIKITEPKKMPDLIN